MDANDIERYPEAVAGLLRQLPLAPLGPGTPVMAVRSQLEALDASAFGAVKDRRMADACRAGLWLAFNFLDESHTISQELVSTEGSFWHAIMHRREPDAANASYWFRRVGEHPIFVMLAQDARNLGVQPRSDCWNPFEFIELCERHRGTGAEMEMVLRRAQQCEWQHLFAWCYTHSV